LAQGLPEFLGFDEELAKVNEPLSLAAFSSFMFMASQ
jgi:hypothetical protein